MDRRATCRLLLERDSCPPPSIYELSQGKTVMDTAAAYSVVEFCRAHRISRAHLYNLINRGDGPTLMKVGKRTLVSGEAALAWRKRMEIASQSVRPASEGKAGSV
jgi:hypothetical protein